MILRSRSFLDLDLRSFKYQNLDYDFLRNHLVSIKVCEYSRSMSFSDDIMLQDQASGERTQDQWSFGFCFMSRCLYFCAVVALCMLSYF